MSWPEDVLLGLSGSIKIAIAATVSNLETIAYRDIGNIERLEVDVGKVDVELFVVGVGLELS